MNDQSPSATAAAPLSERDKNAAIIGVLMSMLLAALDQTIVAPAMPTIGAALGHADYLPWIVTAYLLTATATAPLYGKFSDLFGRRRMIAIAIAIFLAGSLISAIAPNMLTLILGRAVQGLGGGGLFALAQTVIGDLVPPRERGRYVAWISAMWGTASVAGPLLGGFFAEHLHWSLIFWINLPLGAVGFAMMNGPLKKIVVPRRSRRIDIAAALLLVAATSLLMLALNWGGQAYPWLSGPILALVLGSAFLWFLFGLRLVTAEEPLISPRALGNPIVLAAASASFMAQFSFVGLSVYLPLYYQQMLGFAPDRAGVALLGLMLGTVGGANITGRLMGWVVHYKRIPLCGALFSAACMAALAWMAGSRSLVLVELLTIGFGVGIGTMFPALTVSVQNAVGLSDLGVATGVNIFLRSLGGAFGVAVMGAVAVANGLPLAWEGAGAAAGAATAGAFAAVFLVALIATIAAIALIAAMPEKPLEGHSDRQA